MTDFRADSAPAAGGPHSAEHDMSNTDELASDDVFPDQDDEADADDAKHPMMDTDQVDEADDDGAVPELPVEAFIQVAQGKNLYYKMFQRIEGMLSL